jgi:16S rRNA C1402 N4-methylase RsmH
MLPSALQPNETDHVPVLAEEVRELLAIEPGQTVVDATFGAGGHAAVLAADLKADGRFIAIDRDPTVRPYFEGFKRHAGVQSRFLRGEASVVLDQLADNGVHADAILLDLGVSSMQIDRPERGFSYAADAPLDMRMDPTAELTAAVAQAHHLALQAMGEIVHEIDIRDGAYVRPETSGIDVILKGWLLEKLSDQELESHGLVLFQGLHASLSRQIRPEATKT